LDRKVKKLKKEAAGHARAIVEEERLERAAMEKKARGTSAAGEVRGRGRPPKPETEEARRRRAARAAAAAESLGQALGTVDFRDEDSEYDEYDGDDEEGDDEEGDEVGAEDAFDAITASEMQEESDETTPDPRTGRMNYVEAFDPEELATILLKAKGADVVVIPVKEKCNWSDHFVVCTAKSPRHIRMLAGAVLHAVKKRTKFVAGNKLQPGIEGADAADGETPGDDHWMLVDCGSCVVHVFSPDARRRFDLEGLWAPGVPLERRNANDGGALTIDTITADEGDEVADEDDVEIEIDLDDMPGTLDDYEDAYVDPPSWERSITDVEQERVRARGKRRGDTGGFGKAGVNLD
jgi:ribosome silencing factor RsfS/YbeB/iojap